MSRAAFIAALALVATCSVRRIELDPRFDPDGGEAITRPSDARGDRDSGDSRAADRDAGDCLADQFGTDLWICGEGSCGPRCDPPGARQCDPRFLPEGIDFVLVCTLAGCWEKVQCAAHAYCGTSETMGLEDCSNVISCLESGCAGLPVCDEPCTPCDCCSPPLSTAHEICFPPVSLPGQRWILDTARQCYEVVQCASDELCSPDGLATNCFTP